MEFLEPHVWREQFGVNFFGHVELTRQLLPLLRGAKGRVINISSISGRISPPYFWALYLLKGRAGCSAMFCVSSYADLGSAWWWSSLATRRPPFGKRPKNSPEDLLSKFKGELAASPPEVRATYESGFCRHAAGG